MEFRIQKTTFQKVLYVMCMLIKLNQKLEIKPAVHPKCLTFFDEISSCIDGYVNYLKLSVFSNEGCVKLINQLQNLEI